VTQVSKPTLSPEDLATLDPAYWAVYNHIALQSGPYALTDHEYQLEPMQSSAKKMCYMKATQLGITEIEVLKSLHGLIHMKYPQGVLYMFPTTDNVGEFSKSRFNPLIAANPVTIGRYVKAGGKGTDTTSLKKIHNAFLYLRGARLSQSIGSGDEKESVQLRSIPVDRVVFDEVDLMDDDVVAKARGRMGHSKVKEEVYLSNPTLPDAGIDKIWQTSDQRHWFRRCGCGQWQSAELTFPDCVATRDDHTGWIKCLKCGGDMSPSVPLKGEWVPSLRDTSIDMEGRRLSQLMSVYNDPAEILADFLDPPQGNLADVYRLRLGLPYVAAEDRLSTSVVYQRCNGRVMSPTHGGPCAMGVDVGKIKHVVVGCRVGVESWELVRVVRLSSWDDLKDLVKRYNVRSIVVDARPYEDEARRFQREVGCRTWLCEYSETTVSGPQFSDTTGLVKAGRTEVFDATHRIITQGQVEIPRRCDEVDEFARQVCNTAKVLETNRKTGTSVYRYKPIGTGGDHYRNALNYFYLAASGSRLARAERFKLTKDDRAITEYEVV
jgi:hypothetical protein